MKDLPNVVRKQDVYYEDEYHFIIIRFIYHTVELNYKRNKIVSFLIIFHSKCFALQNLFHVCFTRFL